MWAGLDTQEGDEKGGEGLSPRKIWWKGGSVQVSREEAAAEEEGNGYDPPSPGEVISPPPGSWHQTTSVRQDLLTPSEVENHTLPPRKLAGGDNFWGEVRLGGIRPPPDGFSSTSWKKGHPSPSRSQWPQTAEAGGAWVSVSVVSEVTL